MSSLSHCDDPALPVMTMDILSNVLSHADSPGDLGTYLTEEIRELTGARCVLLADFSKRSQSQVGRLVSVNPARRWAWAESPPAGRLLEMASHQSTVQVWRKDTATEAEDILQAEGYALSFVVPLHVGTFSVGALLVLGVQDETHLESEIKVLTTMATVVALVMRNAFLFEQQQETLRQREHFSESVMNTTPDLVYIYDLVERRNVYSNREMIHVMGYSPEQILQMGNRVLEFILHPDDADAVAQHHRRLATANDAVFEIEYRIKDAHGQWRWLQSRDKVFLRNDDGTVRQIIGTALDITEHKQAEQRLQQKERQYRQLFENLTGACALHEIVTDADGKPVDYLFLEANQAFESMTGLRVREIIGKRITEVLPDIKRDHIDWIGKYGKVALEGEPLKFEQYSESLQKWYSVLPYSPAARQFVTLFFDVSDRKRAEEENVRLKDNLKNVIDSMPSMLIGTNAAGRVTQWNTEAEQQTGITADQAQGKALTELLPDLTEHTERIPQAIHNRRILSCEKVPCQRGGRTRAMDMTIYPLVTNTVEGAVVRIDDVTERVRMEEMVIQSEKMLSVGGLAAGMAHEINNPLAGIVQSTQVIQNRIFSGLAKNHEVARQCGTTLETIQAYMEQRHVPEMMAAVLESGARAAGIVDNMLSFARKSDAQFTPCALAAIMDKTVELASNDYDCKKKYDFRQIEIVRDYDPHLPPVPGEAGKLQQVFLNILKNGAQAMFQGDEGGGWNSDSDKDGGRTPRFVLRLVHEKETDMARVELEDNGPGMDEETCKRVFEPFFTTKGVRVGTGLGLSVSYFIVTKNHRGSMSVESVEGQGTTFIICLPLKRDPDGPPGRSG